MNKIPKYSSYESFELAARNLDSIEMRTLEAFFSCPHKSRIRAAIPPPSGPILAFTAATSVIDNEHAHVVPMPNLVR